MTLMKAPARWGIARTPVGKLVVLRLTRGSAATGFPQR
jgi:hypothetical protein